MKEGFSDLERMRERINALAEKQEEMIQLYSMLLLQYSKLKDDYDVLLAATAKAIGK